MKSKAKPRKIEEKTVFVIRDGEKVVLRKRPQKGLLAGMYEFPNASGHLTEEEALLWAKGQNLSPIRIQKLEPAKHIFSHVEWHMAGYEVEVKEIKDKKTDLLFVELEKLRTEYPIPNAFAAYKKHLGLLEGK